MIPTVTLTGVGHRYADTEALAPLDIHLRAETTAVLGPNGSGKSTMLGLIATTLRPQSGSILINSNDVTNTAQRTAIRQHLGYVTQRDGLPDRMTVWSYLDYVAALKGLTPARRRARWVQWARGQLDLGDPTARLESLSGGTRRRVAIAQGLLGEPTLLVADEPLAGLDAESRMGVAAIVTNCGPGRLVVVATHHADELATAADRILILNAGHIQFDGSPSALAAMAVGHTWETAAACSSASRAVAPGRFRTVAAAAPPESTAVPSPAVQDGYHAVLSRL